METIILSVGAIIDKNIGDKVLEQLVTKQKSINIVIIDELYK